MLGLGFNGTRVDISKGWLSANITAARLSQPKIYTALQKIGNQS